MEKSQSDNRITIWNTTFVHAFVTNLVLHLAIYMMNTLSATYADYLGATSVIVGLISGMFAATALIFKMISAPAIDTFNRKHVLMGSIGILLLSYIGYTFSYNMPMLIISRLLTGVGMAFTSTCCLTVASDSLPVEKMASGIGYFTLGTALSQALAPYAGLRAVEKIGYNKTFAVLAVLMVFTIFYVSTMKIEFTKTKKFKITLSGIIAKQAVPGAVLLFFLNMTFSTVNSFLVLFAVSQGVEQSRIGIYFTVYAVTMLVSRPLIGTLADKIGTVRTIIPSMLAFAASFILISMADSLPAFLAAAFVSAFGYGGCFPTIQAVCMKSVPKERRGAASCTAYVGTDLSHLIGPVLAGAVVDYTGGYVAMWRVMLLPIGVAIVLSLVMRGVIEHAGEELKEEGR